MTRKDLNLSLDNSLIQDRITDEPPPSHITGMTASQKPGKYAKASPKTPRKNIPALTIAIIAVTNMVFLLLAGLWLSTLPYTNAATNPASASNTTPQMESMLAETNERLTAVEAQLEQLTVSLRNQQLAAADRLERENQGRLELAAKDKATSSVSAKEFKTPTDNWYVNIGAFTNERAAVGLQNQLIAIGRQPNIVQQQQAGSTVFEVHLSGFGDRAMAETAAGDIMTQTELNGLSVWQVEQ